MCFHKWKEYKDITTSTYYRICEKCGVAQKYFNDTFGGGYGSTDLTLCRTNNWVEKGIFKLRYGLRGDE